MLSGGKFVKEKPLGCETLYIGTCTWPKLGAVGCAKTLVTCELWKGMRFVCMDGIFGGLLIVGSPTGIAICGAYA
jgi:hypothetical protein